MPESTLDRVVLVLGVCALAGLVALIVPAWRDYASAGSASEPRVSPPAVPVSTPTSTPPATSAATRARPRPQAPARPARLTILAAKGDCWIEAREASPAGRLLYLGLLARGKRLRLPARAVWLRLGAAHNLAGWIGSKPVRGFPQGAATVLATPAGVRTLSLG